MRFVLLIALIAACDKGTKDAPAPADPNQATCEHYAKQFRDCHKDDNNPAMSQATSLNLCLKGLSGKYDQMFGARYRTMIECTKTATTCDALEQCNENE